MEVGVEVEVRKGMFADGRKRMDEAIERTSKFRNGCARKEWLKLKCDK